MQNYNKFPTPPSMKNAVGTFIGRFERRRKVSGGKKRPFTTKGVFSKHLLRIGWRNETLPPKDVWTTSECSVSQAKFNAAYAKAIKFFPASAISFYKNFKNNYVLVVKQPVNKIETSIEDFVNKKSYDDQEQADYNLVTSGQYRTVTEQFATDSFITPLQSWEKEVLPEMLTYMENMLLPIKYKAAMDRYFQEHPNSFLQEVIGKRKYPSITLSLIPRNLILGHFLKQ